MSERKYTGKSLDLSWKTPPWMRDDEESSENQSSDNTTDAEATQTTMTTTNTATEDDSTETQTQTQTTIGKDKNGKTITATSPDDFGEIRTEFWPSHIDREDVSTPLQEQIIQTAVMHQEWSQREIARRVGCQSTTVSSTLKEHWPEHPSRRSSEGSLKASEDTGNSNALSPSQVDEIREQFLAGGSAHPIADEHDTTHPTVLKAAKGTESYEGIGSHPPLEFDRSEGGWTIAEDGDGAEPESEPEPEPEPEPSSTCEMVALEHRRNTYHSLDESGDPRCGVSDEDVRFPLLRLEESEAGKVANECLRCRIESRTSEDLLDDIRAELGYPIEDEGTPLYKEELADILFHLRGKEVSA